MADSRPPSRPAVSAPSAPATFAPASPFAPSYAFARPSSFGSAEPYEDPIGFDGHVTFDDPDEFDGPVGYGGPDAYRAAAYDRPTVVDDPMVYEQPAYDRAVAGDRPTVVDPPAAFARQAPYRDAPYPADPYQGAAHQGGLANSMLSAPVTYAPEADELFAAWQGGGGPGTGGRGERGSRPKRARKGARKQAGRGRQASGNGLGWQVAKVGVPAAVIVTVGAGALLMLTGRADNMLAERATNTPLANETGLSAGKPTSGPASRQTSAGPASAGLQGTGSSMNLAGYPAQRGSVAVAALWSAGTTTVAVGSADGHPAVWRHAGGGDTWTLVSTSLLGGVTGHLTSVARGASGWIAVGAVNPVGSGNTGGSGNTVPALFSSADGVTWQRLTSLTSTAGSGAQFSGVAAGASGYLVVGTVPSNAGGTATAALWWSSNLQNWVNGAPNPPAGSTAVAATAVATATGGAGGFVAVGSENGCHAFWTSADGQHWTAHDLAKPTGATSATLTSVAAGLGGQSDRFVATGTAMTSGGAMPIAVTAANDGTHVSQTVLSTASPATATPDAGTPASVTAVTATGDGFVAVGTVGSDNTGGAAGAAGGQRAVTWTSVEGRSWSAATPLQAAGTSQLTALTATGSGGAAPTLAATAQRGAASDLLTFPAP